ncbi:MAG: hypothetical protein EOM20_16635 [Spartobacteria bacterium]|nr:hypothetical protein [Spartobacteria bacterium]
MKTTYLNEQGSASITGGGLLSIHSFRLFTVSVLFILFACLHAPLACADFWVETFDTYPVGNITNCPGWEALYGGSSFSACRVSTMNPYRGRNALLVGPTSIIASEKLACYQGTGHSYNVLLPIVRFSAWVYRDNAAQYLTLSLGTNNTGRVNVRTTLAGNIQVNHIDTGVPWVVGRYARLVLWYNMVTDMFALDYDNVRVWEWDTLGANMGYFDEVRIRRVAFGPSDSGDIHIDDLAVEAYSGYTWAWWRFDEGKGDMTEEFTGWFAPGAFVTPPADAWHAPLFPNLLVGVTQQAYQAVNQGSRAGARVHKTQVRHEQILSANWTVEMIFYFAWEATNTFYLVTLNGGTDGGYALSSILDLWWQSGTPGHLRARLQNRHVLGVAPDEMIILEGVPDNRWHHLAVIKDGTQIHTYLDYSHVFSSPLGPNSSGNYYFNDGTASSLGMLGTNPATGYWIQDRVLVDEVRVTGLALTTNLFLRTTRPGINAFNEFASPTQVYLRAVGMPGKTYHIERSSDFQSWSHHADWNSAQLQENVAIDMPVSPPSPAFFRIREPSSP